MPGDITKRQEQNVKRILSHDYLAEKERKKARRREKAAHSKTKGDKHKSKQQEIEELVEQELELEGGPNDM
ncbi:MAG: hypothetical protein WBP29_03945 [Candidatus Zixiibacteriota bacterium]